MIMFLLQEENDTPDKAIQAADVDTPLMVIVGIPIERFLIYIVAERTLVLEYNEVSQEWLLLFATYHILNMQYPAQANRTFSFMQQCVFDIKDQEKVPPVNTLYIRLA